MKEGELDAAQTFLACSSQLSTGSNIIGKLRCSFGGLAANYLVCSKALEVSIIKSY